MVAASDGSSPRVVTRLEAGGIVAPRWSPDGRKVAMTATAVGASSFTLLVIDVASAAVETVVAPNTGSRPWMAQWTSKGDLVYTTGDVTSGSLAGTTGRLVSLDPGSKSSALLYGSPDSLGRLAVVDDRRLVVESQSFRQNIVEWAGSAATRLSVGRAADRQPIYSSDGKWIVFSSDRSGNLDLWAQSTSSGELRQITDDAADDWDPAFGPGGRSSGAPIAAETSRFGPPRPTAAAPVSSHATASTRRIHRHRPTGNGSSTVRRARTSPASGVCVRTAPIRRCSSRG